MVEFTQYVIDGILIGGVYSLVAIGFIIIYRTGKVFNMAQGEFVLIGGYIAFTFINSTPLPLWLSIVIAGGLTGLIALILQWLVIRPLIGQSLFAIIMVTIGLMLCLRSLAQIIWGPFPKPLPALFGELAWPLGPFKLSPSLTVGFFTSILVIIVLWWLLNRTTLGLTMSAVTESHMIARALGIRVTRTMAVAWAISGVISVMAVIVWLSGRAIGLPIAEIGIRAAPVFLLAGLESIPGALLAGVIVGVVESLAIGYLDELTAGGMSTTMPFLIMLLILLIRPEGLFGWKRIERL